MSIEKALAELTAVMTRVADNQEEILSLAKAGKSVARDADEDETPKKARRARDEDEDEAPKKSKRASRDDDEDEDETPKKSKRASRDDDEDEDETPRKKRASREDDEDEDEAPKKKRASRDDDEDEDEAPKKKKATEKADKPAKKGGKDKGPTTATIRAAIADLMDCDKGDEEDRNDFVEAMFDHLDVANAAEIEEKDFERVLAWIAKKADGKKVKFD